MPQPNMHALLLVGLAGQRAAAAQHQSCVRSRGEALRLAKLSDPNSPRLKQKLEAQAWIGKLWRKTAGAIRTCHNAQHEPELLGAGLGQMVPNGLSHKVQDNNLEHHRHLKVEAVEGPPLAPREGETVKHLLVTPQLRSQPLLLKVHGP